MSDNVKHCQTMSNNINQVAEHISIVLIHKYYVTDMTVNSCRSSLV